MQLIKLLHKFQAFIWVEGKADFSMFYNLGRVAELWEQRNPVPIKFTPAPLFPRDHDLKRDFHLVVGKTGKNMAVK